MKPPLIIEGVEVVSINKELKLFDLIVTLNVAPIQIQTPEVQDLICRKVKVTVNYLVAEGFIPDIKNDNQWKCRIAGKCV